MPSLCPPGGGAKLTPKTSTTNKERIHARTDIICFRLRQHRSETSSTFPPGTVPLLHSGTFKFHHPPHRKLTHLCALKALPPTVRVTSQHAPSRCSCRNWSKANRIPRSPNITARIDLDPTPPLCWSSSPPPAPSPLSDSPPREILQNASLHPPRPRMSGGGLLLLSPCRRALLRPVRSLRRFKPMHHSRKVRGLAAWVGVCSTEIVFAEGLKLGVYGRVPGLLCEQVIFSVDSPNLVESAAAVL